VAAYRRAINTAYELNCRLRLTATSDR
jgi:hypothetical protein